MTVPFPIYQDITVKTNASVQDTLDWIKRIAQTNAGDVRDFALSLRGKDDYETCRNVWNWVRTNVKYKYDKKGVEEIRTPRRTFHERVADCDCMTLFISSLLFNLNIPHRYRIVSWDGKGNWAHIYPVAQINGRDVAMDCIPESKSFDSEIKYSDVMDLNVLAGFEEPTSTMGEALVVHPEGDLNGIESELEGVGEEPIELAGLIEAAEDDVNATHLSGLDMARLNEADVLLQLKGAKFAMAEEPSLAGVHDNEDVGTLSGLISEWCDLSRAEKTERLRKISQGLNKFTSDYENRVANGCQAKDNLKEFYAALAGQLEYSAELEGMDSLPFVTVNDASIADLKGYIDETLSGDALSYAHYQVLSGYETSLMGLGKKKRAGIFKKISAGVKKGLKKAGTAVRKGLNKVKAAVVKYNPATILIRNGILLAMKINAFKIGSRLVYGYMTPQQAQSAGLDLQEHAKVVAALRDLENTFVKIGGNKSNLEKAIKGSKKAKAAISKGNSQSVVDKPVRKPTDPEDKKRALALPKDKRDYTEADKATEQYLINKYGHKGMDLSGLGVAPAAAPVAAATPILVKLANLLKKINFKKLFAKSKIQPTGDEVVEDNASDSMPSESVPAENFDAGGMDTGVSSSQTNSLSLKRMEAPKIDNTTDSAAQIADTATDTAVKQGWFARTWADPKKKKWLIVASVGLVLLIVFAIWFFTRKKKSSLAGKRRRRKTPLYGGTTTTFRARARRKPSPIIAPKMLAGPSKRKPTKRKKRAKTSRRK